jgi:hypothetical protein
MEDLRGKLAINEDGRYGYILEQDDKRYHGITIDNCEKWESSSPEIIAFDSLTLLMAQTGLLFTLLKDQLMVKEIPARACIDAGSCATVFIAFEEGFTDAIVETAMEIAENIVCKYNLYLPTVVPVDINCVAPYEEPFDNSRTH